MVEPEMAYATLEDVKQVAEKLVVFVVSRVLENRRAELAVLERDPSKLEAIQAPFPCINYCEAVPLLQGWGSEITWGGDFGGGDETILSNSFNQPVIVERHPAGIRHFSTQPDPNRSEVVLSIDLLAPEGYGLIAYGGQRIDDLDMLLRRIREWNLPKEALDWYIDLRRFGSVPHGGFGLGVERVVAWLCGLDHVREAAAFPRTPDRIRP
jgi:asparaginyl-tRNA synthetase